MGGTDDETRYGISSVTTSRSTRSNVSRYSLRNKKTKINYREEVDVNSDHMICK